MYSTTQKQHNRNSNIMKVSTRSLRYVECTDNDKSKIDLPIIVSKFFSCKNDNIWMDIDS